MKEYHFQFCIDKMTEAQAKKLFDMILTWVENNELDLGGGYCTWKQWEETHGKEISQTSNHP